MWAACVSCLGPVPPQTTEQAAFLSRSASPVGTPSLLSLCRGANCNTLFAFSVATFVEGSAFHALLPGPRPTGSQTVGRIAASSRPLPPRVYSFMHVVIRCLFVWTLVPLSASWEVRAHGIPATHRPPAVAMFVVRPRLLLLSMWRHVTHRRDCVCVCGHCGDGGRMDRRLFCSPAIAHPSFCLSSTFIDATCARRLAPTAGR